MNRTVPFLVAMTLTACGAPSPGDPRHADVVVEDEELRGVVLEAAGWWYEATDSDVAFRLVGSCAPDVVCERIRLGELPADEGGLTAYPVGHPEDVSTTISVSMDPALRKIDVAHELGHVLGLGHTDGVMTPSLNDATWTLPSEWMP
ncbi:MAG TPA: hypothetical protein VHE30_20160 [Polyangiaceae bacterium]|nr:hypothetical protein [Polyangiaceae bacterium]